MKKNLKMLAVLLMAAITMTAVSCSEKEDDPQTGGNGGGDTPTETPGRMYGTQWLKTYKDFSHTEEGYYQDHLYIHFCTETLEFTSNTSGERHLGIDIYDEMQQETVEHLSDTVVPFTYVYKGGDNMFGQGMIYWGEGDSTRYYIQGTEDNQRLYLEGVDYPDNSQPVFGLVK